MVNPFHACVFLSVALLAELCTDTGPNFKFVCIGDSVRVFQDITSSSFNGNIIIYKTFADKEIAIATLSMQDFKNKDIILEKYKDKISLENGSMMIHNLQASDEATYVMLYNNLTKRTDVHICALAPPTKRCKPNIKEDENILTVSLDDHNYCGRPVVSVHWMEYPNNSYIDETETIIELPPGTESGTYRACIKGEALKCVNNSKGWNNCVKYTTKSLRGNNHPATSSDIPQMETYDFPTFVIVLIVLSIVLMVLLRVILNLTIFRPHFGTFSKLKIATDHTERVPSDSLMRTHPLLEDEMVSDGEQRHAEAEDETTL